MVPKTHSLPSLPPLHSCPKSKEVRRQNKEAYYTPLKLLLLLKEGKEVIEMMVRARVERPSSP
jgi:hypothetical protein